MTQNPELPLIDPQLTAEIIESLPARIRRRVDAVEQTQSSWVITASPQVISVTIASATVTLQPVSGKITALSQVACTCLLYPKCAHIGAVALSCEISSSAQSNPEVEADNTQETDTSGEYLTETDRLLLTRSEALVGHLLRRGSRNVNAELCAGLLACLHQFRVASLVSAERSFSGFVTQLLRQRQGQDDFSRAALARHLVRFLLNLRELNLADQAGQVTTQLRGQSRRKFQDVGTLSLRAICAEPVFTDSGYAGVVLTFSGTDGKLWTISEVVPGDWSAVTTAYIRSTRIGELNASLEHLSRRKLLLTSATASEDGRLGAGKQVRAALGAELSVTEAWQGLPESFADNTSGLVVLAGTITSGSFRELCLHTAQGEVTLELSAQYHRPDIDKSLAFLGRAVGVKLRCLVRVDQGLVVLLAVAPADEKFVLPDSLRGRAWIGLDQIPRSAFGELAPEHPASSADPTVLEPIVPGLGPTEFTEVPASLHDIGQRWLLRCLLDGQVSLVQGHKVCALDQKVLLRGGAPFFAQLLSRLDQAAHNGSRDFAGVWLPDENALREAWLALGVYLYPK